MRYFLNDDLQKFSYHSLQVILNLISVDASFADFCLILSFPIKLFIMLHL